MRARSCLYANAEADIRGIITIAVDIRKSEFHLEKMQIEYVDETNTLSFTFRINDTIQESDEVTPGLLELR